MTQQQKDFIDSLKQAQEFFRKGELSEAKRLYSQFIDWSQRNNLTKANDFIGNNKNKNNLYDSLVNLAIIELQKNNLQVAKQLLIKAIKILPTNQRYQAIYNLSIVFYYLSFTSYANSSSSQQSKSQNLRTIKRSSYLKKSLFSIKYSLSILLKQLGIQKSSLKLLNKSIELLSQCNLPPDPKLYIYRGLIFQSQKKIKLAENEFQRIMYEIDESNIPSNVLQEIYTQKVIFYRRIKKVQKMEQNLKLYLKCQRSGGNNNTNYSQKQSRPLEFLKLMAKQQSKDNDDDLIQRNLSNQNNNNQTLLSNQIQTLVKQAQQLIKELQSENRNQSSQKTNPNQSIAKAIASNSQKFLEQLKQQQKNNLNQQPRVTFKKTNSGQQNQQRNLKKQQQQSLPSRVQKQQQQKQFLQQQQQQQQNLLLNQDQQQLQLQQPSNSFKQSHPSQSINQDEDSAILNQRIQRLQRQIQQSGGNVPEVKDQSLDQQDQDNFLEFQIQRTIEEIKNKKVQEERKQIDQRERRIKQSKIKQKQSIKGESGVIQQNKSPRQSIKQSNTINQNDARSTKRDSAISDTKTLRSVGSILSQTYELTLQQIKSYKSFKLQIRSLSMFQEKHPKKQAFVKVTYNNHFYQTQKCKNDKLTWNYSFDSPFQIHHSEDEAEYQLKIQCHAKQGGWLSWNTDYVLGTGVIKLTDKGETKCTLENNDRKVGILYYKLKLAKQ